ncbi:MAG TPA: penicillin-binding transpeptidase domain-containing protein, partial [Solirubrobacteraceae bacterium]|nr:penicillin-binding transpeptidase domain-containing protein [Solirubrobacteraceae bacterium]
MSRSMFYPVAETPPRGHSRGGGRVGGSPLTRERGHGGHGGHGRVRARRIRAVLALAGVAFVLGAIVGADHTPAWEQDLAARFTAAWARGDYARMYSEIDPAAQREVSVDELASAYREAALTATVAATGLRVSGPPRQVSAELVVVPVRVRTRLFGTLSEDFRLPIRGRGEEARIAWSRSLAFPGLRTGERLSRRTTLPPRAALLAQDGSTLASGTGSREGARESPLGATGAAIVGTVGAIPEARRAALLGEGDPADATVGLTGLERTFDARLRGTPGGELLAGGRVLANVTARAGAPVRTSISPAIQRAATLALGGRYGGIVVLDPRTGAVRAVAGIGIDALQPPGSTFKMVTLAGVLQAGIAKPTSLFPYATSTTLDGVRLANANGESCGGSLALAFATSCNSVFAPLGVRLGAARLVATAEAFGFNHDPGIPGAAESTIPPAPQIQGELALGSTAIGQGEVQASALEMAVVAATIADGGARPRPTFLTAPTPGGGDGGVSVRRVPAGGARATSSKVARTVRRLMIGVVREGTGTAAAIPGVVVAG